MKITINKIMSWLDRHFAFLLAVFWAALALLNLWIRTEQSLTAAFYQILLAMTWFMLSITVLSSKDSNG
jgi:hypothetical protein